MSVYRDELYHWGIKGMKWGVRRYQSRDGTLTSAGRKRYSTDDYKSNVKKAGNVAKQLLKDAARPMDKGGWTNRVKSDSNPWDGNQRKTAEKLERYSTKARSNICDDKNDANELIFWNLRGAHPQSAQQDRAGPGKAHLPEKCLGKGVCVPAGR